MAKVQIPGAADQNLVPEVKDYTEQAISPFGLYYPGAEPWETLIADADEVLGHELISGEAADRLIGVPFLITRLIYRPGVMRHGAFTRDDYMSAEAVIAPLNVISERARKGRLDLDTMSVEPGEHIVINDGSTGIYRQGTQYLAVKGLIGLPDTMPEIGPKGESRYDLPRSEWLWGADQATAGISIRMLAPRGLRYSEYDSEYTADGTLAKTRYIA